MPKKKQEKGIPVENSNNFYKAGWKPNSEFNHETNRGEITEVTTDKNYHNNYDNILKKWGFNPKEYEIDGILKVSSWNAQLKGGRVETFYAFKGTIRRKNLSRDKYYKELF